LSGRVPFLGTLFYPAPSLLPGSDLHLDYLSSRSNDVSTKKIFFLPPHLVVVISDIVPSRRFFQQVDRDCIGDVPRRSIKFPPPPQQGPDFQVSHLSPLLHPWSPSFLPPPPRDAFFSLPPPPSLRTFVTIDTTLDRGLTNSVPRAGFFSATTPFLLFLLFLPGDFSHSH